jgi:hypothetical protein
VPNGIGTRTVLTPFLRNEQPRHHPRQAARFGELEQWVKVIAHQALVVQTDLEAIAVTAEEFEEMLPIRVVVKDGLPGMPTIDDVVTGSLRPLSGAWFTRHEASLSRCPPLIAHLHSKAGVGDVELIG